MREQRIIDQPREGYFMIRLAKGAAEIPACIRRVHTTIDPHFPLNRMDRSSFLAAFINGEPVDLDAVWLRRGRVITETEYRYQVRDVEWARTHAPSDPKVRPDEPIDLFTAKPPF